MPLLNAAELQPVIAGSGVSGYRGEVCQVTPGRRTNRKSQLRREDALAVGYRLGSKLRSAEFINAMNALGVELFVVNQATGRRAFEMPEASEGSLSAPIPFLARVGIIRWRNLPGYTVTANKIAPLISLSRA
jgi:hypothetical protein